jgi:hypothetical protein
MAWYRAYAFWKRPSRPITRTHTEWPLRLGCGCVNLYAGFFLLTEPARFYQYVPTWLSHVANTVASIDAYLRLQGIGEIMIALGLLGWFLPRWCVCVASTLLAVEMLLILICVGVDTVTFRNIGLLGAALSLLSSTYDDIKRKQGTPLASAPPGSQSAHDPAPIDSLGSRVR